VDPFDYMTTAQAARHCGVATATVRKWVQRGKLTAAGRDEAGRMLFRAVDVARAEHATRRRARRAA